MKTPCPPLENKGSNALDGAMKDNPGVNSEPDMGKSLASPKPNMTSGYSQGALHEGPNTGPIDSDGDRDGSVEKDPFAPTGYYDDEY